MLRWFRRRRRADAEGEDGGEVAPEGEQPAGEPGEGVAVPVTDALDLHAFAPREVADLVAEYLHAAHAAGFRQVRIIHGKGIGALRRTVHAALERHPLVRGYRLADDRSGWGATLVDLDDRNAPLRSAR